MSAYNNPLHRANTMTTSSMLFSHTVNSPQQFQQQPSNSLNFSREHIDHSSSDLHNSHQPKCMTTQSVIFAPRSEGRPTLGGLSKLDGMARHVNLAQSEEFPSQKRNSCDKAPFMRGGFPGKEGVTFPTQFNLTKQASRGGNCEEEMQNTGEQIKRSKMAHKRRESV